MGTKRIIAPSFTLSIDLATDYLTKNLLTDVDLTHRSKLHVLELPQTEKVAVGVWYEF